MAAWSDLARRLAFAASAVVGTASGPAVVLAGEQRAIIIFDGSGSMWGRIGERSKFEIAQESVNGVVPDFTDRVALGLMSYGHRRKGDCNDIQMLVRPSLTQGNRIGRALKALSPKGKTPIASSLEAAASALIDTAGGHIILLTDGIENCRTDLCGSVQALKEAAPKLTINVVGLGMRKADVGKVKCIAAAGGGRLVAVNSAPALRTVLTEILDDIVSGDDGGDDGGTDVSGNASGAQEENEETLALADTPPRLLLNALRTPNGPRITKGVSWRVTALDPAKTDPVYSGTDGEPVVDVEPGRYRIDARMGYATASREITVSHQGERSVHLPLNVATLKLDTNDPASGTPRFTVIPSANPAAPIVVLDQSATELHLSAGEYRVQVDHGIATAERVASLSAGEIREINFELVTGRVTLLAVNELGGTIEKPVVFKLFLDDPGALDGRREVARTAAQKPVLNVPTGVYHIVAETGYARAATTVTVSPGGDHTARLVLRAGHLRIRVRRSGHELSDQAVVYVVTPLRQAAGQSEFREIRTSRRNPNITVPAGTYRVTARAGAANAVATSDVIVNSGAAETVELTIPAAALRLRHVKQSDSAALQNVSWEVRDSRGLLVFSAGTPEPRVILAPGTYRITAERSGRTASQSVTVSEGDNRTVQVPAE